MSEMVQVPIDAKKGIFDLRVHKCHNARLRRMVQVFIDAVKRFLYHLLTDPNKAIEDLGSFPFRLILLVAILLRLLQLES